MYATLPEEFRRLGRRAGRLKLWYSIPILSGSFTDFLVKMLGMDTKLLLCTQELTSNVFSLLLLTFHGRKSSLVIRDSVIGDEATLNGSSRGTILSQLNNSF